MELCLKPIFRSILSNETIISSFNMMVAKIMKIKCSLLNLVTLIKFTLTKGVKVT